MVFLTMLPLGDLLNFGKLGNNHLPLTTFGKQFAFGVDEKGCFSDYLMWKTRSDARIN